MPLTDQIKNSTALYAVVGAGDLAVEKLRAARTDVVNLVNRLADEQVNAYATAQQRFESAASDVQTLPDRLLAFPEHAQVAVNDALLQAERLYGELASRGKVLVDRINRQQATQDLRGQAQNTTTRAKATRTSARKTAGTTATTAKTTARSTAKRSGASARKSAGSTRTQAKGTATSARRTASAARKATGDAAKKVGD